MLYPLASPRSHPSSLGPSLACFCLLAFPRCWSFTTRPIGFYLFVGTSSVHLVVPACLAPLAPSSHGHSLACVCLLACPCCWSPTTHSTGLCLFDGYRFRASDQTFSGNFVTLHSLPFYSQALALDICPITVCRQNSVGHPCAMCLLHANILLAGNSFPVGFWLRLSSSDRNQHPCSFPFFLVNHVGQGLFVGILGPVPFGPRKLPQ